MTDQDYLDFDPFCGDEAEVALRTTKIRKARKQHKCFGLNGKQDHFIEPGQRYRHERALIDGSFFGEYKICLRCIEQFIEETK